MARAVTLGMMLRGGSMATSFVVLASLLAACASGGKDRDFSLPAGNELDGVRSEKVLVVVEARNECQDDGVCVPAPTTPCHLGEGNTRGLAVYRLGTTGLLFGDAAVPTRNSASRPRQPRRIVVHPTDPTLIYVATCSRVQVVRLRSGGGSACIAEGKSDQEVKEDAQDSEPVDMAIDPSIGNGVLYVAGRGSDRIDAYTIAPDGTIPALPTSCIVGGSNSEFAALTPMGDGFFAAGGSVRVEIHPRVLGQFLPEPDPNATATPSPIPTVRPSPAPGETPGPVVLLACPVDLHRRATRQHALSAISAAMVTQMFFSPSARVPLGTLFLARK
jgi:hypothetical protein